jgi:hypothetical protein
MSDPREFDDTKSRARRTKIAAAMRAVGAELDEHCSYEALAAVVDDSADDVTREIVESHAAVCPTCKAELDDLRVFAGRGARRRPLWWAAAAAAVLMIILISRPWTREPRPTPIITRPSATTAEWQKLVADTLRNGRLEIPPDIPAVAADDAYRDVAQDRGVRTTVTPSGMVIDELQPTFHWSGPDADDYEVAVYENGTEVVRSKRQTSTAWTSPRALERGKSYRWQVIARKGSRSFIIPSPLAPPAVFRILDARQHDELARAAKQHPNDDLLLGILYARAGILDRARAHLARSPAGQRLLSSLDSPR